MAKEEDYYEVLGVARGASQADIQKAYRDAMRKYHPDVNPDKSAKKKTQQVQRAYEVLNDPPKRELYDRYGSSFENMAGAGAGPQARGAPGGGGGAAGFEDFDFSQFFGERYGADPMGGFADIFSQVRRGGGEGEGRSRRGRATAKGTDTRAELEIPFQTAVAGGEAEFALQRDGKTETIRVKIPPGVDEGKEIRLRGQGEEGRGGRGDLLLRLRIAPHPWYARRGKNLYVKLPIGLGEAAAGAKVDVPTPYGTVALRVPPGTTSGAKLRIKGHGVRPRDTDAGDLFAEVQIVLPKDLDAESRAQLEEIDRKHPTEPRRELRW